MIVDRTCDGPFALYDRKLLGDAAQAFMASPDVFSQIAAAVCLMVDGKTLEGRAVLEQVRVDAAFYALSIDKLLFRFSTDEPIRSRFSGKDASILFLELLQKHGKLDAARLCLKRFPSDPKSIEIYVYECLNNGSYDDITDALLTKARALVAMQPSQRSLTLFVIALIRSRIWKEAIRNLQTLCVLAPAVIPIAKPLLAELTKLVT
jgi:hypothetical protein